MKKISLRKKIEVMHEAVKILNTPRLPHYLCNIFYDFFVPYVEDPQSYAQVRSEFIRKHFSELLAYDPRENKRGSDAWFANEIVGERLDIVNDLIYRYNMALMQKKSVHKIKGRYVAPPYNYFH